MQQFETPPNPTSIADTETVAPMRLYVALLIVLTVMPGSLLARPQQPAATATSEDPDQRSKFATIVEHQKANDAALDLFERIERVEVKKTASSEAPPEVKISRVVPAGTGVAHIAVGPDGATIVVTNSGDDSVSVLSARTGEVETVTPVAGEPFAVATARGGGLTTIAGGAFIIVFLVTVLLVTVGSPGTAVKHGLRFRLTLRPSTAGNSDHQCERCRRAYRGTSLIFSTPSRGLLEGD